MPSRNLFDPHFATRRRLKTGLVVVGALAGAVFGIILTRVGKIVSGAPPATLANYAWNAIAFGLLAGVVSPIVTWSALRPVPLWRTMAEPLVCAVAGAAVTVILGVPELILILPPVGLALGFLNLRRRYPDRMERLAPPADACLPVIEHGAEHPPHTTALPIAKEARKT